MPSELAESGSKVLSGFMHKDIWASMINAARRTIGPSKLASAYISLAGIKLLPLKAGSKVVVNAGVESVMGGSTDVKALNYLFKRNIDIYSLDNLHSKVFLFDGIAFVGSTNISLNSSSLLVESSYMTSAKVDLQKIENFIDGICTDKIDEIRLKKLNELPKFKKAASTILGGYNGGRLVMQLTGESRGTQVQPPVPIWTHYFGIDITKGSYPTIHLMNSEHDNSFYGRKVVKHDHTLTIEIPGSNVERPAIIEMIRAEEHFYRYRIFSRANEEFDELDFKLRMMDNPLRTHGRRWLIL